MKNSIVLIILLLLVASVNAQFLPGDVGFNTNEYALYKKNKVNAVKITVYDSEGYLGGLQTNYYDTEGKLQKVVYDLATDSELSEQESQMNDVFIYNTESNVSQINMNGYDMMEIQVGFEYKKGKLEKSFVSGAEAREYSYVYDKSGHIIEKIGNAMSFEVDDEGNSTDKMVMTEVEKSVYTWDKNGNLIDETFYMYGEFFFKTIYNYNKEGMLVSYNRYYDPTNLSTPSFKMVFEFNDKGLPIKSVAEEDGIMLINQYTYTFY